MNVIVFTKGRGSSRQLNLVSPKIIGSVLLVVLAIGGAAFAGGIYYAAEYLRVDPDVRVVQLTEKLDAREAELAEERRVAQENMSALAVRLGQVQAHVIRLDALGRRLTEMAGMQDGEFNFDVPPPRGGPMALETAEQLASAELNDALDDLNLTISDRDGQLSILESLMLNRNLQEQVYPRGRPVDAGWMSSYFGHRVDPFTGKRARHDGIDFAGKEGAAVIAVGAGVVSWSGDRYGYGNLVEVNHGNGYATRYAHNKVNLVAVGDKVEKGQVIALMGATGRATGPNLHFEVLESGRAVNPLKYINDQD